MRCRAYLITFHMFGNMNGREVNVLGVEREGSWCLFSRATHKRLPLSTQTCKASPPHLLIEGCCTNQIVLICSGYSGQWECERRARDRGQAACPIRTELAPVHASRATSQWIINLSASISALESFPNTKAKCPPCSEVALLRVCGYFNKN